MSREAMSEEERRRRRNEASRRCYLKRKAFHAAQKKLASKAEAAAKGRAGLPKAKTVEAKPARAKPVRRGPDPVVAAERLCKTYARVAGGIKPMLKDAAEFLGIVYKSEDQRVVEKVERILVKGLGVSVSRLASDPTEKTRVCLDAVSKAVKTPKFRLDEQDDGAKFEPFPGPGETSSDETETESASTVEVPVDPALLEKVDAGEADKSEIEIPQDKDGKPDESEEDGDEDELENENEDDEDDEDDEDEDEDEDDDSEEAQERRARRREREESDSIREYESGRWEMMGEMGAQGAFDD